MYSGLIIKESLCDETILDYITIKQVEIWATDKTPKYWTAISFESNDDDFLQRLSKALAFNPDMPWYVDLVSDGIKYIVLSGHVLKYTIGNEAEKEAVIESCRELGVKEEQLDWCD